MAHFYQLEHLLKATGWCVTKRTYTVPHVPYVIQILYYKCAHSVVTAQSTLNSSVITVVGAKGNGITS